MTYAVDPVPGFHLSEPTIVSRTRHRHRAVDGQAFQPSTITLLQVRASDDSHSLALRRDLHSMHRLGEHPHVLTIRGAGLTNDRRPYLVHPRISERTLADRLVEGPLSVQTTLALGVKISCALQAAHARGLTHGHLSTQSILIERGEPLLADVAFLSLDEARLSVEPEFPGMAPEGEISLAADRYALGVILFSMLRGRAPLDAETADDLSFAPEPLRRIIGGLMHHDPALRADDLTQVITELQDLQLDLRYPLTEVVAGNGGTPPRVVDVTERRRSRRRERAPKAPDRIVALLALVAGVLIASIVVATAVVFSSTATSEVAGAKDADIGPQVLDEVRTTRQASDVSDSSDGTGTQRSPASSPEPTTAPNIRLVDPASTTPDEVLGAVIERGQRTGIDEAPPMLTLSSTTALNQADAETAFSIASIRLVVPAFAEAPSEVAYVLEVADASGGVRGSNLCLTTEDCEQRMRFDPPLSATSVRLRLIDDIDEPLSLPWLRWCVVDASGDATPFGFPAGEAPDASTGWCA